HEELLYPGREELAVDRSVDRARRDDAVVPETGEVDQRLPARAAPCRSAACAGRPRRGCGSCWSSPRFVAFCFSFASVDEYHAPWLRRLSAAGERTSGRAGGRHPAGPAPWRRASFLNVLPQRFRNCHKVSQHTSTPRSSRNIASKAWSVTSLSRSIRASSHSRSPSSNGRI